MGMVEDKLMIGDWANMRECIGSSFGEVRKITMEDLFKGVPCEPIALTSGILEKNGFSLNESGDYIFGERVTIQRKGVCIEMQWLNDTHLWSCEIHRNNGVHERHSSYLLMVMKYVHELQHSLRICGLIDMADDFKVWG